MSVSATERNALSAWAKLHGGRWKQALCFAWQNAEYPGVNEAHAQALQSLRNSTHFGPRQLKTFKLEGGR